MTVFDDVCSTTGFEWFALTPCPISLLRAPFATSHAMELSTHATFVKRYIYKQKAVPAALRSTLNKNPPVWAWHDVGLWQGLDIVDRRCSLPGVALQAPESETGAALGFSMSIT